MKNISTRIHMAVVAVLLCGAAEAQALDAKRVAVKIPSQPVLGALKQLGEQTGLQMLMRVEGASAETLVVESVDGELTLKAVLDKLLAGTGLTYEFVNERTVRISRPRRTSSFGERDPVRVAQVALSAADASGGAAYENGMTAQTQEDAKGGRIEEVVVTAQKREERLIDVPQSMSVLSADNLSRSGVLQLRDYAHTVPGLSFTTAGAGFTQISLRGVTVGTDAGPTVGIYVDEVPYGGSTPFSVAARATLDVGLFDLDRVEVLRGPQGTLYGASTMGGLIKYVTKRPDATRRKFETQTGFSSTHQGGLSYNAAASVNLPLVSDKVALRASGFESHDGGYIDNLARGRDDVNRSDLYGGRFDLLAEPTEDLSFRLAGFLQNISREGEGTAGYTAAGAPLDGTLDQRRPLDEPFDQRFRLVSGTVSYDLGPVSLTSISSYQTAKTDLVWDVSAVYVPLLNNTLRLGPYSAVGVPAHFTTDKFSQEIRLASGSSGAIEWLFGGFYVHEKSVNEQIFSLLDTSGQPAPNTVFTILTPSRYDESAAFGNVTWRITDKFDITGGVRYAENRQRFEQIGTGVLGRTGPTARATDNVSTYLAHARYHLSDNAVGYLRYATGYRPGGPNFANIDATTGLPIGQQVFESDSLRSYEGGFKLETAERRFGLDLALYEIDWTNIQLTVTRGGFGAIINAAGGATVRGAELTLTARPLDGLKLAGAFAYQDAELSENEPALGPAPIGALKGERLPNVPERTAALDADYELPLGTLRPTIGATLRYVDDRTNGFGTSSYRLPAYDTFDLRAGVTFSRASVQLYARNLLDERGQLALMQPQFGGRVAIIQPRTIGMSVTTSF